MLKESRRRHVIIYVFTSAKSYSLDNVCVCVCVARTLGLHIKGIEENSRAKKEELFREEECIVQINATPLQDKTFAQSVRRSVDELCVCVHETNRESGSEQNRNDGKR